MNFGHAPTPGLVHVILQKNNLMRDLIFTYNLYISTLLHKVCNAIQKKSCILLKRLFVTVRNINCPFELINIHFFIETCRLEKKVVQTKTAETKKLIMNIYISIKGSRPKKLTNAR